MLICPTYLGPVTGDGGPVLLYSGVRVGFPSKLIGRLDGIGRGREEVPPWYGFDWNLREVGVGWDNACEVRRWIYDAVPCARPP